MFIDLQNYEEGELLSPPTPLPLRSRSVQGGAQSPGVRGGYGREGEDSGVHSYVVRYWHEWNEDRLTTSLRTWLAVMLITGW